MKFKYVLKTKTGVDIVPFPVQNKRAEFENTLLPNLVDIFSTYTNNSKEEFFLEVYEKKFLRWKLIHTYYMM